MSCKEINSLTREGTSLFNRVLAALSTNYAMADERQPADIILFAKRYAAYLDYYDANNTLQGNWQTLMKMDACVALAELFKINSKKNYNYRQLLYKQIKLASLDATDPDIKTKTQFKFLFDFLFSLVRFIDEQYALIPGDFAKKEIIKGTISNKMAEALTNLVALYEMLSTSPFHLIDPTVSLTDESNAPIDLYSSGGFDKSKLTGAWKVGTPLSYSITDAISIPVKTPSFTEKDQVVWLINHNLFNTQIYNLFNGISFLITRAEEIFNQVISDYPKHSPHYALFLSFIRLFRFAQDDLNRFTQRHLDFYYKDILRLKNKDPQPDFAHLVFELQKPVNQHLLKKGSLFKGGKDITGKEIKYSIDEDLVLNKASVEKIQSWQFTDENKKRLKASAIANSDDGETNEISSVDKSWFTFGDIQKQKNAESGFAIASNILFLNEGYRIINFTINFKNKISASTANPPKFSNASFKINLSGKKGWHHVKEYKLSYPSNKQMKLSFTLSPSDPAIIPYDEKIHKAQYELSLPVISVYLDQDNSSAFPYTFLCNKIISSIDISVNVTGIKDLSLSHDSGNIDAFKPFKPFGDFPGNGASFYIGSKEVFQKRLSALEFAFEWKDDVPVLKSNAHYLKEAVWNDPANSFKLNNNKISFSAAKKFNNSPIDFEKNTSLETSSIEGFFRIQNATNFSQQDYLNNVKKSLNNTTIAKNNTGAYKLNVTAMPVPNEIILNSFSINYQATATIHFVAGKDPGNDHFFHLTPLGYYQVHPDLIDHGADTEATERITLLPDIINAGELFIGLGNTAPGSLINILFQVADGSSNPLKEMEALNWFFLAKNNNWKKFDKQHIIDRTNNFTQAGIVTITLPPAISNDNTALQKGLYWIKATVAKNTDAVCRMILIQAQAAKVRLQQDNIRQIEFRQTLPANSISKLVTSDAAIKTITQPFDSFDGRTREQDEHFYVRVSERLRHKQRAISTWDYEHIILEQFQSIFKVKCLNHSGFYMEQGEEVFCENYPGHITIITIPNQKNKQHVNPLKPYTSIGLLNNISEFLKKSNSPFVKLHVKNPQFEEIQLDFKVKFYDNLDESFYLQLLNNEIEKFLCPWAFEQDQEISFGGKIVKSVLLNFIEERPYVDYITCFKMNHIIKRNGSIHESEKQDLEEAVASTSRSLLVSYYNEETNMKHKIVSAALCDC